MQKNFFSRLYKKEIFQQFKSIICERYNLFRKTVKLFFSQMKETVVRIYNLLKIINYYKIIKKLNTFFKNAVLNLNVNESRYIINHDSGNLSDPVDKDICKYKFHPSILLIKKSQKIRDSLRFNPYLNLTWRKKLILKRQLLRTLSHPKY